jgi:hypothetical protein
MTVNDAGEELAVSSVLEDEDEEECASTGQREEALETDAVQRLGNDSKVATHFSDKDLEITWDEKARPICPACNKHAANLKQLKEHTRRFVANPHDSLHTQRHLTNPAFGRHRPMFREDEYARKDAKKVTDRRAQRKRRVKMQERLQQADLAQRDIQILKATNISLEQQLRVLMEICTCSFDLLR